MWEGNLSKVDNLREQISPPKWPLTKVFIYLFFFTFVETFWKTAPKFSLKGYVILTAYHVLIWAPLEEEVGYTLPSSEFVDHSLAGATLGKKRMKTPPFNMTFQYYVWSYKLLNIFLKLKSTFRYRVLSDLSISRSHMSGKKCFPNPYTGWKHSPCFYDGTRGDL